MVAEDMRSGVGLTDPTLVFGLSGVSDWSTQVPFLDLMKMSRPLWGYSSGWENLSRADVISSGVLDEHGWPTAIPDGMTGLRTVWAFPAGTPGSQGPFVLTWEGEGSLSLGDAAVVSSGDHRIVFTNTGSGTFWLNITATDPAHTGDYIHNIKVVPAKYEALAALGEIFNPDWLSLVQDARQLRFMDWMGTNGSTQSGWAGRPEVDDVTWSGQGVPVEIMVALANQTGTDPWFNIPHLATDEYIEQFAIYVRDHLNPALKAHVEYSNETWNWAFGQTKWLDTQAKTVWGSNDSAAWLEYFAKRATETALIWDKVFGASADTRVENVLAVQTAGTGWSLTHHLLDAPIWRAAEPNSYVPPASVFDAIAVTTYFGGSTVANTTLRAELLTYIENHSEEQSYDWLADKLKDPTYSSSIPQIAATWAAINAIAEANGLDLLAYEGGQHVHQSFAVQGLTSEQLTALTSFMTGFVRSQQMANLYVELWNAWSQIGDGPFMQFGDVGAPGKSGSWGLLSNLADTNPRAKALFELNAQQDSWFGDGGGTRYQQGVIKLSTDAGETLTGTDKDDFLVGGNGDDTFIPGLGNDRINGGKGNDTYVLNGALPFILDEAGIDLVQSSATQDLGGYATIENLTLTGADNIDGYGNGLDNTIRGNAGWNQLFGLDGNDLLYGGAGNDVLDGDEGDDVLRGESGNDTYVLGSGNDVVIDDSGWDTITSTISRNLNDYPDIENLTLLGSANINATGNQWSNVLIGNDGDNVLDGGPGADTLMGGQGNDTYVLSGATNDTIIDTGGNDTITSTITRDLRNYAGIENLTLTFSGNADAYGDNGANVLTGNAGRNQLFGLGGNDTLYGGAGNDTLDGGAGLDRLEGGLGNDIYVMGDGFDIVVDEGGWDEMTSTISRDLNDYPDIENLTLLGSANINATGNQWSNKLVGNDGDNVLDGGPGADTLMGGLGNDTYVLAAATNDTIYDIGGLDTISSTITRDLRDYSGIENLTLTFSANVDATGNQYANVLTGNAGRNTLWGLDGDDILLGMGGNDTLYGGTGNDTLDGGAGADILYGGLGNDTYMLGDGADTVVEEGGWDTITSTISRSLADYPEIENLTLLGTDNINATGNQWSNTLIGNDGDNILDGGAGADILMGGLGNDTYVLAAATNDTIIDVGGIDTISSTISRDLANFAGIENITLTFSAHVDATGDARDNVLLGNAGNNVLDGKDGNDVLNGGAGHDTLVGGGGKDSLTGGAGRDVFKFNAASESAGQLHDVITDFVSGEDKIDLSAIDARPASGADDAFTMLETEGASFSNTAGELRWYYATASIGGGQATYVEGDIDGDGQADLLIELGGQHNFIRDDFLL